jgi:predicted metal-binding protein
LLVDQSSLIPIIGYGVITARRKKRAVRKTMSMVERDQIHAVTPQELANKLIDFGASDARVISAQSITIEDRFAEMCASPQCPNYGLAPSCPPHVMKPGEFRKLLTEYEHAIVFKIDTPTAILMSEGRREVARLIHEMSSITEQIAREAGYPNAKGLAAGSCKQNFCHDRPQCTVLASEGDCPFSDRARPSISGLGVNFLELCKLVGWHASVITGDTTPEDVPIGMLVGIVLVG